MELPEAARRQLAGLDVGEIELDGRWSGATAFEIDARGRAFDEAYFRLQGDQLELRVRELDLAALGGPGAPLAAQGRAALNATGSLEAGQVTLDLSLIELDLSGQEAVLGPARLAARYRRTAAGFQLTVDDFEGELRSADALPAELGPLLPIELVWRGEVDLEGRGASGSGELTSPALGRFPSPENFRRPRVSTCEAIRN